MKNNLETIRRPVGSGHDVILEDFSSICERLEYCGQRINSLMTIVLGATTLLEAQHANWETKSVSRLTILALVFAPLSFTTGLFSMSGRFLPGQPDGWVFWAVSVPLIALVFILVPN